MNTQDPLANLQPLREPELIGWWPLAPGWWVLIGAALLALGALGVIAYRRWERGAYRRQALQQLDDLQNNHQRDSSASDTSTAAAVNALLKSVALVAYGNAAVASHHGEDWRNFLNHSAPGTQFPKAFTDAPYRRSHELACMPALFDNARRWIKHHREVL